jgi:ATP-dependent Clp protease ATP-binding subunit ClpB
MTKYLETPLAKELVSGNILPNAVVLVGLKDDNLVLDVK